MVRTGTGRPAVALAVALILALVAWPVAGAAQPAGAEVVLSGLDAPRSLAFGPDGALYVAEAGRGGDLRIEWLPPFGFAMVGDSGRITRATGGQRSVVASGIQSLALGPGAEVVGLHGLAFVGSTLYAVMGQANPIPGPRETRSQLVRVGPGGALQTVADLGAFERANDPAGDRPDSNPFDLTAGPDGDLYVAEAGGNAALRVTPGGQVSVLAAWSDNPVPTGVAFDRAGEAHVSFLSGFPFAQGSTRVERVRAGGTEPVVGGLTGVVDVAVGPDGALYVLEMAAGFQTMPPPPRWIENSGRVLRVAAGSPQVVVAGLNYPTKMAFGPDGALYVNNNSTFVPPGRGEVLRIALAQPAAPQAPAQVPRALPRTGELGAVGTLAAGIGTALLALGLVLRRARWRT